MHFVAKSAPLALLIGVLASPGASAGVTCDDGNPYGPSRSAVVRLTAADYSNEQRTELKTFVETGSLGRVEAEIVSPRGLVRSLTAAPAVSRYSRHQGENLRGIAVELRLNGAAKKAPVVRLRLRQVCAVHFHDTFLYR
jgi:hypothetical protein